MKKQHDFNLEERMIVRLPKGVKSRLRARGYNLSEIVRQFLDIVDKSEPSTIQKILGDIKKKLDTK